MDLERLLDEIDDPVVGDGGASVEAALLTPVEGQARLGHLHEQGRSGGVPGEIIPRLPGNHDDIGLGLRFVVEGDGILQPDQPAVPEGHPEGPRREGDGRRVRRALRLGDDELAAEQLDGLVLLKEADLDQLIVFPPGPVSVANWRGRHRLDASHRITRPSMSRAGYAGAAAAVIAFARETSPRESPCATRESPPTVTSTCPGCRPTSSPPAPRRPSRTACPTSPTGRTARTGPARMACRSGC